jgi:dTDP-4-amino-4,6-dideoxygalactose transaminase
VLRDHGQIRKYFFNDAATTGSYAERYALSLHHALTSSGTLDPARRENAALYDRLLSGIPGVGTVNQAAYAQSVYHLYVILVDDRDGLQQFLNEKGIGTGLHYPLPLHLQQAYAAMSHRRGDFPVSERTAERLLSLPMYAELKREQIEEVVDRIREYVNDERRTAHGTRHTARR